MNIKLLRDNAKVPVKATDGAAGYDCFVSDITYVRKKGRHYTEYALGFGIEIPKGYVGLVFARSSIRNNNLLLPNGVGGINSDYRGELKFTTVELRDNFTEYKIGERCCQLVIVPIANFEFNVVDELNETVRGEGGHGSTGK